MATNYFKNTKTLYGTRNAERNKRTFTFVKTKVTLYQRADNGSPSWYFKIRLKGERQYYKRSLKTASFTEAKELAEEKIVEILGAVKSGNKIVSLTLNNVFRQYKLHLDDQVRRGMLRPSTLKNLSSRLNTATRFISHKLPAQQMETRVGSFDGGIFEGYLEWREAEVREKTENQATLSMIRDELLIIRKAFRWASQQKLVPQKSIPVWTPFKSPEPKRARFLRSDYNRVVAILNGWSRSKSKNDRDSYYKQMVRHGFLVIANCGLRSGELFGLKNSDLEISKEKNEVVIRVRAETTKVKQERKVFLSPVESEDSDGNIIVVNYLLRWINESQRHNAPEDFVFAEYDAGSRNARQQFYSHYRDGFRKKLVGTGLEKFDLYHCRHMFITFRLEADQNIYKVAKATGTSLTQIEKTYSHLLAEQASREIQQVRNKVSIGRVRVGEDKPKDKKPSSVNETKAIANSSSKKSFKK